VAFRMSWLVARAINKNDLILEPIGKALNQET